MRVSITGLYITCRSFPAFTRASDCSFDDVGKSSDVPKSSSFVFSLASCVVFILSLCVCYSVYLILLL